MSEFKGFEQSNTTPVPDILFDELLSILTGSELKVLLYIIRRTAGFKKSADAISLSQFEEGIVTRDGKILDHGCGISDRKAIRRALEGLEKKHCIERVRGKTASGDSATTLYKIHFISTLGVGAKSPLPSHLGRGKNHPTVGAKSPPRVGAKTTPTRNSNTTNSLQETESSACSENPPTSEASLSVSENNSSDLSEAIRLADERYARLMGEQKHV